MKQFYLILFIIFQVILSDFALSDDTSWCDNAVDLSSDFTPTKDQHDLPYCYAFAVTSLVENYECRSNRQNPCRSLSVMDAISQYPDAFFTRGSLYDRENFTIGENGGYASKLLKIIKDNGLCLEELAPDKVIKDSQPERQGWIQLAQNFSTLYSYNKIGLCDQSVIDDVIKETTAILRDSDKKGFNERLMGALIEPNSREFLKSLFVSSDCVKNRIKSDFDIEKKGIPGTWIEPERSEFIKKSISRTLRSDTPLLVSMACEGTNICEENAGLCGDGGVHALVIKGMRKNKTTGKCELLLHNSWGKWWQDKNNGGYVDADLIINNIHTLMWLR